MIFELTVISQLLAVCKRISQWLRCQKKKNTVSVVYSLREYYILALDISNDNCSVVVFCLFLLLIYMLFVCNDPIEQCNNL